MKSMTIIGLTLVAFLVRGQSAFPTWGQERFQKIANTYGLADYIKPQFLQADLSGDKNTDLAILIERRSDKKKGILILFGQSDKSFILGAGINLSNAGDNFDWADTWSIFNNRKTYETTFKPNGDVDDGKEVILHRPAIAIREEEGSGGLIYFAGEKFVWIHQGD